MIKIGIVGTRGLSTLKGLQAIDDVQITAMCDLNEDHLKEAADRIGNGDIKTFRVYEDMLESDIDAVIIATPMQCHVPQAITAMEAGKHVMSEKPMAASSADAKKMIEAWKKSGKQFFLLATHGPLGDVACGHAGRLLTEFDKNYNTKGLPTIVVGDMNAWPGHSKNAFYENMIKYFEDTYEVTEKKCGTIGTFNGSKEIEKNFKAPHRRIDHIYVRSTDKGKIQVKNYTVNNGVYWIFFNL